MDQNDKQEDWNNKDNKNLEQEDNKRMKIEVRLDEEWRINE